MTKSYIEQKIKKWFKKCIRIQQENYGKDKEFAEGFANGSWIVAKTFDEYKDILQNSVSKQDIKEAVENWYTIAPKHRTKKRLLNELGIKEE